MIRPDPSPPRFPGDDDPTLAMGGPRVPPADPSRPGDPADDPRLLSAVQEYQAALDAGRRPNRREFVARHPDIAADLSACLDGLALLHSTARQMSVPGTPGGPQADAAEGELATAKPLGDFRLIREIGRGGMGVVYEAEQLSLGRRVAVKVLPLAAALDARHLQRFKNEAQAAAQLHHTNIVPVYAVGHERSVHFYAMQLIDGRSLSEVIRELRDADVRTGGPQGPAAAAAGISSRSFDIHPTAAGTAGGPPGSALDLTTLRTTKRQSFYRAVARLGLQAADALDYAHRQGVVHRDVKPANLLLDDAGTLWVTDFGLAQIYADSNLTLTGEMVGTVRYMSPEQASGRAVVLDQRTDVYSLGMTLYELVTLERAFSGETREQLLYQIEHEDPRSPRAIDKAVPPELETILAKATAKDPADRYAAARGLAEDLRRFLADEPILARPPSLRNKAVKWVRRHKGLAGSAVAMLLLAAVGLLISNLLIAAEQKKTESAYQREQGKVVEATEQRARAEKSFQQAREAVDFFTRVAAEDMDKPDLADVRREMLGAALSYYQSFLADRRDDPRVKAELDAAAGRAATLLAELSSFDALFRAKFRAELLGNEAVRADLGMTDEQVKRLGSMVEVNVFVRGPGGGGGGPGRGRGGPGGDRGGPGQDRLFMFLGGGPGGPDALRQMTPEQKRDRFDAETAVIQGKLAELLSPPQVDRLRQISRQVWGPLAFNEPEVAEALGLTKEQRERARAVQAKFRDTGFRRGPAWAEAQGDSARRREAVDEILAGLTPAQALTWATLTGKPFAGNVSLRVPGFGPPR